jgi:two-component system OmpR family response regulator
MTRNVLVIEDQADIAGLIRLHLQDLSCSVDIASDGVNGLALGRSRPYDLIILDLMLPELDGLEVCRELRASRIETPVMMLTAKAAEFDRVLGLELGADDYLTKPFSVRELIARVKAIFRRIEKLASGHPEGALDRPIQAGDLHIDPVRREARIAGDPVPLTSKEFDLLLHFARNPGRVYTRVQLLDAVWGRGFEGYEHNVNCHINRLRAKIETNQARPAWILTVRGVGYKFADTRPAALSA